MDPSVSADTGSERARRALIVANSTYDDVRLRRLRAPATDAAELASVLGDPAIGDYTVEALEDADEGRVRRRLSRFFRESDRDDTLLVHFACHGVKDDDGHLYFAAKDTDVDDLDATAVASPWLRRLMDRCLSR